MSAKFPRGGGGEQDFFCSKSINDHLIFCFVHVKTGLCHGIHDI